MGLKLLPYGKHLTGEELRDIEQMCDFLAGFGYSDSDRPGVDMEYRYANSAMLRLPGEPMALQTSDRNLYVVYVVADDVVDRFEFVARDEDEIRFKVARMDEYAAYKFSDLEIVIKPVAALRPSKDS